MISLTVPGSTVLRTTTVWRSDFLASTAPISRTTFSTNCRSRSPFFLLGVPTQIIERSESRIASAVFVVARMRPASTPARSSVSRPGSTIGDLPALMRSTLTSEMSTPITLWPRLARQPAQTAPT